MANVIEKGMKLFGGARGGRSWRPGMMQPAVPGRDKPGAVMEYDAAFDEFGGAVATAIGNRTATGAEMMLAQAGNRMREEIPLPSLTRVMVTVPGELDIRQRNAIEEENLLGYSAYRKALGLPGPLARTLAALEIPHLDPDSVVKYKYAMMAKEQRKDTPGTYPDLSTCELPNFEILKSLDPRLFSTAFIAFDSGQGFVGIDRGSVTVVRWGCTALRGYEQAVPDFARSKALEIKRACPGVEFFVEELRRDQVVIDPFLIAVLGDELFYIEVWGEPEFESQMEHNQV